MEQVEAQEHQQTWSRDSPQVWQRKQTPHTRRQPGSAEWELHRREITELYQSLPLGSVSRVMKEKFGFDATYVFVYVKYIFFKLIILVQLVIKCTKIAYENGV